MNGREQVEQYAELAKPLNPDQRAPASTAFRPSELGGIKLGDAVRLPNIEATFEVIAISDPLLTLRAPSGREVKAGWRSVQRLRRVRR
jgi:hypothetical protein